MNIEEALRRYLVQLEADGRSPHTIAQARRHVFAFSRWAESEDIEEIDHETVAAFLCSDVARCRPDGRPKKPTAVNALRSSLRTFFRYCHDAGLMPQNPARLVRRARCGTAPPRGLSDDEQCRLIETLAQGEGPLAERDHALFHLLLAAGLRIGAALGLDVEDVDIDRAEVFVRRDKCARAEIVFLAPGIVEHLRTYLAGRSGALFQTRDGRRMSVRHAERRLAHWLARAGIERRYGPHALRHSFAQALYERTRDVALVQSALRHRSVVSTLVYARTDERRVREALGA